MIGDKGEGMGKGKREIPVAALEIILGLGVISQFYHPAVRWGDLIPRSISRLHVWRGRLRLTALNRSFIFPITPPGPGGTCFPGMPVTLILGTFFPWLGSFAAISTSMSSKKSRSCTEVNASPSSFAESVRCDLACGVVIMGRSRRREASTFWSKWSLREKGVES